MISVQLLCWVSEERSVQSQRVSKQKKMIGFLKQIMDTALLLLLNISESLILFHKNKALSVLGVKIKSFQRNIFVTTAQSADKGSVFTTLPTALLRGLSSPLLTKNVHLFCCPTLNNGQWFCQKNIFKRLCFQFSHFWFIGCWIHLKQLRAPQCSISPFI